MHRQMRLSTSQWALSGILALGILVSSCTNSGNNTAQGSRTFGNFRVLTTNLTEGAIWQLNRPIFIEFNNSVDPNSVSFGSILIRPLDSRIQGQPVTGSFEFLAGSNNRTVVFYPSCPTNPENDNGAFVPGGFEYELALPIEGTFGSSVLRDTSGTQLSLGLTRTFYSPDPASDPLFIDNVGGPPVLVQNAAYPKFPTGLNLFTNPDPTIEILFNQAVSAIPTNLNTDNLYVLYEDSVGSNTFTDTNRVPGQLLLVENCSREGAIVHFLAEGLLPPGRRMRLVVDRDFADIGGEVGTVDQTAEFVTPDLQTFYGDPTFDDDFEVADAFCDNFDNTLFIDPVAELPSPFAVLEDGRMTASFDFPGVLVPPDADFLLADNLFLEVDTDGTEVLVDSNGRNFTVLNGVMQVDDFMIEAGATLRGIGSNPLVIYANGTINIQGTLDVSGNNAEQPKALNSPHIPEPGAEGNCGGGNGGGASLFTDQETLRGASGDGPFGLVAGGGQGGEGGVQTGWAFDDYPDSLFGTGCTGLNSDPRSQVIRQIITGGGAGGTFAMTPNLAVLWDRWSGAAVYPTFDNAGPDFRSDRHTALDPNSYYGFMGGEDGMRGSSWDSDRAEPIVHDWFTPMCTAYANGLWGMEDLQRDTVADDSPPNWDPAWTGGIDPPFNDGTAQFGPDPGFSNASPFNATPDSTDDFWGRRYDGVSGEIVTGELLAPWAGYGGGASGDLSIVDRNDRDFNLLLDPMVSVFPDTDFPANSTLEYLKGAPGGGGGGQLIMMAIGPVVVGAEAVIKANGGIGAPGESYWITTHQISGSGGGSGGQIVIHSSTGLDLSAIDVGTDPVNNPPAVTPEVVQAIGGRRGWAGSSLITDLTGAPNGNDGNGDFMVGRGGAGGNGLIQVHVPDPLTDIAWHPDGAAAIEAYIGAPGGPVNTANLEEILALYSEPGAFSLLPVYSSTSMFQSTWVDTGLASLRQPVLGSAGSYPDYASTVVPAFDGIDGAGEVLATGALVNKGTGIATGAAAGATFNAYSLVVTGASGFFAEGFLLNPSLLQGYDVYPDSTAPSGDGNSFEITSASYNMVQDRLTINTRVIDGMLTDALVAGGTWSVNEKFFRIATTGQKDRLPSTSGIVFEFQGAPESAPGSNEPGPPTAWTADLSTLEGSRFFRYRVTFDIDANNGGVTLSNERPGLDYIKVPFGW